MVSFPGPCDLMGLHSPMRGLRIIRGEPLAAHGIVPSPALVTRFPGSFPVLSLRHKALISSSFYLLLVYLALLRLCCHMSFSLVAASRGYSAVAVHGRLNAVVFSSHSTGSGDHWLQ